MKLKKRIALFLLVLAFCFVAGGQPCLSAFAITASAESASDRPIDNSDPLDDLSTATIEDEEFSLMNYSFDFNKSTELVAFYEFGFDKINENKKGALDYYLYIYNPKHLDFESANAGSVTFGLGYDKVAYVKYNLEFVSASKRVNYEGLFYKFKVSLTSAQRENLLANLNATSRIYRVSEVELAYTTGEGLFEKELVNVSTSYSYSGYMPGFGTNTSTNTTLSYTSEKFDTLSLDVKSTFFRAPGVKPNGTQAVLHSVYFAVPNKFINEYGELAAVHATWLNAVLKPALVTGDERSYNALMRYLGRNTTSFTKNDSLSIGSYRTILDRDSDYNEGFSYLYEKIGYSFNFEVPEDSTYIDYDYEIEEIINSLCLVFHSGNEIDSADHYNVSSDEILDLMKNVSMNPYFDGSDKHGSGYVDKLFSSVDSEYTDLVISRDDDYTLENNIITQSWWQKLWGTSTTIESDFENIKAIEKVTSLSGNKDLDCEKLFIDASDYEALSDTVKSAKKNDETVYLFRYMQSEYHAEEATFQRSGESSNTNAYFFTQTVNLDFDVIDVTFSTGERDTVIPVIMKSIDITPDSAPPLDVESDAPLIDLSGFENIFDDIVSVVMLVIGLFILAIVIIFAWPFISPLLSLIFKAIINVFIYAVKGLVFLILLPFRLIRKKENRHEKKN